MLKRLITVFAAGALVLGACGSDSGSDASDDEQPEATEAAETAEDDEQPEGTDDAASAPSDVQAEAADAVIAAAQQDGIELDADCVDDLASQLSDEDAQAIVDAEGGSGAEVSDEGTAIGNQLLACAGNDQIIDVFIEQMNASGQEFDEECVRDGLKDIDLAELAGSEEAQSGTPDDVVNAVIDCFELGS